MADGRTPISLDRTAAPVIRQHRLKEIRTYEIQEETLDNLDGLYREESDSKAWFAFCGSLVVSLVVAWVQVGEFEVGWCVGTALAAVVTAKYLKEWRGRRKQRKKLLDQIRERSQEASGGSPGQPPGIEVHQGFRRPRRGVG